MSHIYVCICVCICVGVCVRTHMCVGIYIYICIQTHAHMYGCTHTRVYTCMCIYPTHSIIYAPMEAPMFSRQRWRFCCQKNTVCVIRLLSPRFTLMTYQIALHFVDWQLSWTFLITYITLPTAWQYSHSLFCPCKHTAGVDGCERV